MTPGNHNARRLALTDARLVPLDWLSVMQIEDTELPPRPHGIVRLSPVTPAHAPEVDDEPWAVDPEHTRPRVVHRRRRRSWRQVAFRAAAWVIERAPAILCVVFVAILVVTYLRHATP